MCGAVVVFHRPDIATSVFYAMRLVVDSCIMLLLFLSDKCVPYHFPHKRHTYMHTCSHDISLLLSRIIWLLFHSRMFVYLYSFFSFIDVNISSSSSILHHSPTSFHSIALHCYQYFDTYIQTHTYIF